MFRIYQIENPDDVPAVPKILAHVLIEFGLGIGTDDGISPLYRLKDCIPTECSALHAARCPIYGNIVVPPFVSGKGQNLAVPFSNNDAVCLAHIGHNLQKLPHFLFRQEAGRTVGAFFGIDKIPFPIQFPATAKPHPHDHKDQKSKKRQAYSQAVQAIRHLENSLKAFTNPGVRKSWRRAVPRHPASCLPCIVVAYKLRGIPAAIKDGKRYNRKDWQQNQPFFLHVCI